MAGCTINEKQFIFAYGQTKKAIDQALENKDSFDAIKYLKYFYNDVVDSYLSQGKLRKEGAERAAEWIAELPSIIDQVIMRNYNTGNQVSKIKGFYEIQELRVKFNRDGVSLKEISKYVESLYTTNPETQNNSQNNTQGSITLKGQYDDGTPRLLSRTILSTTLPIFKPKKSDDQIVEEIDEERSTINKILSAIMVVANTADTSTQFFKYQGNVLMLKAVNADTFTDPDTSEGKKNLGKLDSLTQQDFATSRRLVKEGKAKESVTQLNERVLLVVTDENGNAISFDKDANVTAKSDGNYAFQFLRDVKKVNGKFQIKDLYGIADTVSIENVVKARTELDKTKTQIQHQKDVEKELQFYLDVKNKALEGEDIMLDILGLTEGVDPRLNKQTRTIRELIEMGKIDEENLTSINLQPSGWSKVMVGEKFYMLDRMVMSKEISQQIVEVLFSKKLSQEERKKFVDQFIPENQDVHLDYQMRKHKIVPDPNGEYIDIQLYNKRGKKDIGWVTKNGVTDGLIHQMRITKAGVVTEWNGTGYDEVNEDRVDFLKQAFLDALQKVYYDKDTGGDVGTRVHYQRQLLEIGDQFQLYDLEKKRPVNADYYDFIKDGKVIFHKGYNSILNQQLLFKMPNDTSKFFQSETPPIEKQEIIESANQAIIEAFGSEDLFDLSENQPGTIVNGEFVPANLGAQLFEAMNKTLKGEVVPTDKKAAAALFKKYVKTVHPDKNLGELTSIVSDSFFKAMNTAKEQGRVDILNNLKEKFDVQIKKVKRAQDKLESKGPTITPEENKKQVDNSAEDVNSNRGSFESPIDDDFDASEFERSGKLKNDKVSAEEIAAAEKWWKNSPLGKTLQKYISLNRAANIVNSDAYANFVVNMARLGNPNMLGTINLNTKGTMVDMYHEAFHGFTQLFLTVAQKKALYSEVMNYTDAKGNQPYLLKSAREIEEILAEDFRTYMKSQNVKKGAPVRNTLFRRILEMIRTFFNKLRGKQPKAPSLKEVSLDIMSVPGVKELYENLRIGSPEFLNKYQASIDNARFYYLERGPQFVEKLGKEKNKRQALSAQDGKLVTDSMDSIISSIIDRIYVQQSTKGGNKADHVGMTLSMLLNPKLRGKLYGYVKQDMINRHAEIAKQWEKSTETNLTLDSKPLDGETDVEALERKSVVVLEKEDGRRKFIMLRSQIDSFESLNPNLKEDREKGESYYGISITGDYFVHKSIRNREGEPGFAEIIVVSDVNDAKKQYDNYIKVGAKYKTIAVDKWAKIFEEVEDRKPKNLTAKQEIIFNNLRILSAAIDQYGDPQYMEKGEAPTGMIAYHVKNSDFEIGKLKYFLQEDIAEQEGTLDNIDPEFFDNKKSILEMADNEVVYILKSLHKVKVDKKGKAILDADNKLQYLKNQLGFKERADFRKTWNVVSKSIQGIQSRKVAYATLVKEVEKYPELKQLIETKLPNPGVILNRYAMRISGSFFKTYSRPKSDFQQLSIYKNTDEKGEIIEDKDGNRQIYFAVKKSTADTRKVMLQFQSYFKMALSPYIILTDNFRAILDIKKLMKEVSTVDSVKERKAFLLALGIRLDNTETINDSLKSAKMAREIAQIHSFAKSIAEVAEIPVDKRSDGQKKLLNRFINDPVNLIKQKNSLIDVGTEIPGYKDARTARIDTALDYIASIQSKLGYDSPGETVKLPDGNKAYSVINHMSLTSLVDGLNTIDNLKAAWTDTDVKGYLGHLKPGKNFFTNRSKYMDSVYNTTGDRSKKLGRQFNIITIAGSEIINNTTGEENGLNTADLTAIDKFYQELNIGLTKGIFEFVRHAEKKLAYALVPNQKVNVMLEDGTQAVDPKTGNKNLWIDVERFDSSIGDEIAVRGFILDQIATEFDRIKFFAQNPSVLLTTQGYNTPLRSKASVIAKEKGVSMREAEAIAVQRDFKSGDLSGQNFTFMDDLLTEDVKKELIKLANDKSFNTDIVDEITSDTSDIYENIYDSVVEYFDNKVESLRDNYLVKTPYEENQILFDFIKNPDKYPGRTIESVLRAFLYNDWIAKFESFNLVNGDGAQFDHNKEAGTKRAPGSTSNGDTFMFDEGAHIFMSNVNGFNAKKNTYSGIKYDKQLTFNGTLNTGIIDDPIRLSLYLPDMQAAWRRDYSRSGVLTEAEIEERVKKDSEAYEAMAEADGAAFLTLDSYRMLKFLGNEWSNEQENLYQDIINERPVDSIKVTEFFPVYKLHYQGPITNAKIATTGMYKFAVAPIIPSIAVPGTELHNLQEKMIGDNMNMMLFGSGSKIAALTTEEGNLDNIFNETDRDDYETVNMDAKIRLNQIHVRYLKDVTKVTNSLKNKITLGTQDRVISLSTLFDMGEYTSKVAEELGVDYAQAVENLTEIYQDVLLDEIGFKFNSESKQFEGDLENLIQIIKNDLELKGIAEQLIGMLDVSLGNHLKHDFSIIPIADVVESIIVTKISKAIVNQKTKGESMVQVPSTFYNGLWDNTGVLRNISKNEANRKKYLGSNNLPYYLRGEVIGKDANGFDIYAETALAKIAIPLNGDWVNLLNLEWEGKQIGTIERLNQLIKDEDFLKVHKDKLTVTGPRIPTDAINLKEAFEVWHFIDASAGNTVVVPTEIVAKAGSDFDIDKIFFSFPNIEKNGKLTTSVLNYKEKVRKLRSEGKSAKKIVQQQKRFAQNEWVRTSANILKDESNYGYLTKPISDYLLKDAVDKRYQNSSNVYVSEKQNVHSNRANSPSRLLDAEYNLNKHKELLGGNRPLGILAKKSKQHELYKSIGAKLPKGFKYNPNDRVLQGRYKSDINRDFVLHFKHQETKQGNISLSNKLNVDGENIGEILSHYLQAILDRANDSFASKANITKEALPVLLRMIESGISKDVAISFINQPLIIDYLQGKSEQAGFVSKELRQAREKALFAKYDSEIEDETLKVYKEALSYSNTKRITEIFKDLEKNNSNLGIRITYSRFTRDGNGKINPKPIKVEKTYENFKEFDETFSGQRDKIKTLEIEVSALSKKRKSKVFETVFQENYADEKGKNLSALKYQHYYITEYLWKKAFGSEEVTATMLNKLEDQKTLNSVEQLALLGHFFQIEDQSMGMVELEQVYNPDTSDVDTLVGVESRYNRIEALKNNTKIDPQTLDKLVNSSIISSTYKTKIYKDIAEPLFDLRLDRSVMEFITNILETESKTITARYGYREREKGRFVNQFNNTLIDFIYQNTISNFTDEYNLPVELPEAIGNRTVEKFKGSLSEPIKINDTKIKVDLDKLKTIWGNGNKDLKKKLYLTNSTKGAKLSFSTRGLDTFEPRENPFDTADSFVRYMVQKEILYQEYSISDFASRKQYETFISKKALKDTYNSAYIKGTTKYSYTRDILNVIKNNQDLLDFYPVLKQFGESFIGRNVIDEKSRGGLSLLELKDKNIVDPITAQIYFNNLKDLGNVDITKKTDGSNTSDEISELFKDFSMMMFYQQGVGRSSISFSNILDGEQFSNFMNNSVNSFMAKVFTENNKENLENLLEFVKESVLKPKGFKKYLRPYSEFLGANIEASDLLSEDSGFTSLDKVATNYNIALANGNVNLSDSLLDEYMQLRFELAEEIAKTESKEKSETIPEEKDDSVEVSSTLKNIYDNWDAQTKSDVGLSLEMLQKDYLNKKRFSLDLTEEQYMDSVWNDTCF